MKYNTVVFKTNVLLFCLFAFSTIKSQDDYKKFKFGLKGSGNLAWNKTENKVMENGGTGLGFSYGLMADYKFAKNYALSFGLDVFTLNNKMRYLSDTVNVISKTSAGNDTSIYYPANSLYSNKFGYVNLPFALKMSTNEIGYMTYFMNFGVELGVRYRATADIEYNVTKPQGGSAVLFADYDISNQTSLFRTALVIGGGFEYNIAGNTNLLVGLTFISNGFSNMYTKNYETNGVNYDNKTIAFDSDGDLKLNAQNKVIVDGDFKKAYSRYVALNVGVFF